MAKLPATSLRDLCHATELAEAAYSLRHVDAAAAERYARLAVKRAERLPAGRVEADARAFAWAHLGNALRIGNDLLESESALLRATQYLDDGSGDCALRADILSFRASTLEACRRFEEAATALRECLALRRALGDPRGTAGCLVQLANVGGHAGNVAEAIRLLTEALPLIADDPRLAYAALHNLCVFLVMSGHAATAQEIVLEQEVGGLVCAEPLFLVRRRWLLAEIAGALGDHEIAATELAEVRDIFLARDQYYDAALVGLEQSVELGALGHTTAVESVLFGVASIFSLLGISREATAARLLEDAARNSSLAVELVPRVIAALRREPIRTTRGEP
jgi:tetratricopeptide (TPR) repeat protein